MDSQGTALPLIDRISQQQLTAAIKKNKLTRLTCHKLRFVHIVYRNYLSKTTKAVRRATSLRQQLAIRHSDNRALVRLSNFLPRGDSMGPVSEPAIKNTDAKYCYKSA